MIPAVLLCIVLVGTPSTGRAAPAGEVFSDETKLTATDTHEHLFLGNSVDSAGDIDGDGFVDVIIGAMGDTAGGAWAGSAYVWYGHGSGIDTSRSEELFSTYPGVQEYFGTAVAGIGDLDGDGYAELAIGSPNDGADGVSSGITYLAYGSSSGLATSRQERLIPSDGAASDHFGYALAAAGDLDGDGHPELAVGALDTDGAGDGAGSVYLYFGSTSGLDASSEQVLVGSSTDEDDAFGRSVDSAGDIDGDGYGDLVVGSMRAGNSEGAAFLFYGSATGIDASTEQEITASDIAPQDWFGAAVAGGEDLDGDGHDDVVVGAYGDDDGGQAVGSVYVFYGSATGIDTSREQKLRSPSADDYDLLGFALTLPGDLNGDGYGDLVAGALYDDGVGDDAGSVYAWFGTATGIAKASEHTLTASDASEDALFGGSMAGLGDLDGDGRDELLVGAHADGALATRGGAVYLYKGGYVDVDGDGVSMSDGDCDDNDASVAVAATWFLDADEDAYGDPSNTTESCHQPGDYVANDQDCDDTDPTVNPAGEEQAGDEVDQDCDGSELCYEDLDGDGFTVDDPEVVVSEDTDCSDAGEATDADPDGDCDDEEAAANPGGAEICDGIDNDCDGLTDPDDADDAVTWYQDADGDGYGDPETASTGCPDEDDPVTNGEDCEDLVDSIHPGAEEIEDDGIDQDCDGADATSGGPGDDGGEEGKGSCSAVRAPSTWVLVVGAVLGLGGRRRGRGGEGARPACSPRR